ncbi:MAG: metallophosphoesterase [Pseudomonadales bacterium]
MRIFLASDIHFEFHNNIDWLPPLPTADMFDVLVLAGDIGHGSWLAEGLRRLRKHFPSKPIVYVAGNHEFYRRNITRSPLNTIDIDDFYFLEKNSVTLFGYQFVGTTLWTGFDMLGAEHVDRAMHEAMYSVADFMEIRTEDRTDTAPKPARITPQQMRALYQESKAWLDAALAQTDADRTVVVTHFPPGREFRHGLIRESLIAAYFQADCVDLILRHQPALWLYGHNHWSNIHACGKTRVVSNQFGYPNEHTGYQADMIIELPVVSTTTQHPLSGGRR